MLDKIEQCIKFSTAKQAIESDAVEIATDDQYFADTVQVLFEFSPYRISPKHIVETAKLKF